MNKFKIISLVLAASLVVALARLVSASNNQVEAAPAIDKAAIVLENIHSRKSVRSFTDQTVSREQLDTLLRAAMAAPSGWDLRPWCFAVLDDRKVIDELAAENLQGDVLKQAPAVIVVCGDMSMTDRNGDKPELWEYDCSLASENLLLAAEAMGLGAVWMKVSPDEERIATVRKVLGMPKYVVPLNMIPVGYPKGDAKPKDKYDANNIHFNQW